MRPRKIREEGSLTLAEIFVFFSQVIPALLAPRILRSSGSIRGCIMRHRVVWNWLQVRYGGLHPLCWRLAAPTS
jgi:hypothetical protein